MENVEKFFYTVTGTALIGLCAVILSVRTGNMIFLETFVALTTFIIITRSGYHGHHTQTPTQQTPTENNNEK